MKPNSYKYTSYYLYKVIYINRVLDMSIGLTEMKICPYIFINLLQQT